MRTLLTTLFVLSLKLMAPLGHAEGKSDPDKYYLFIGKMDAYAISSAIKNPRDTFAGYAREMEELGGKLHSYYWAVQDTTMYAIVSFPSHKEAAAQRYQRGSVKGLAEDIQLIEIFTSEQMVEVFQMAREHDAYVKQRLKALD